MVSPIYLYGGFLSHAGTPIETPIYGILHMGNMNDIRWVEPPKMVMFMGVMGYMGNIIQST